MKEIILGDYKLVHEPLAFRKHDIYHHDKHVGWAYFNGARSLISICTDDTDLITLSLLMYQPAPEFKIYPYREIILGDYTLVLDDRYYMLYYAYHRNKRVGVVIFKQYMSIDTIFTNDTDLITVVLLKFQPAPGFKIEPF